MAHTERPPDKLVPSVKRLESANDDRPQTAEEIDRALGMQQIMDGLKIDYPDKTA